MIVKTNIFNIARGRYRNLSEMALAMGISVSQIYRIRQGTRRINQKFIIGALKAFPECTLDELFYLAPGTHEVPERYYKDILDKETTDNSIFRP